MSAVDRLLAELADLVAERLADRIAAPRASEFVDQSTCGFDARTYVRAARAGEFPASKVGRRWIAKRADVGAWLESKQPSSAPKLVAADADAALYRRMKAGQRRAS